MTSITSIGDILADARRERRLTVKDVERAIKIRSKYIEAMEHNAFQQIAEEAYVVGFLKTYAQWLSVDSDPLLREYRRLLDEERERGRGDKKKGRGLPAGIRVAVIVSIAALVGLALFVWPVLSQVRSY